MKKFILTAFALCLTLALVFGWMPASANAVSSDTSDLEAPTAAANGDNANRSVSLPSPALKFASAQLKLEADLTVTFMVKGELFAEGAYENPRVVYSIPDVLIGTVRTQEVTEFTTNSQGRMLFPFTGIAPRMMKAPITATLYGTYEGVEYSYSMEYKVSDYCYNLLNKTANHSNTKLMTLVADLLNFGTAHQKYAGHDTNNLINAEMTDFHKSFASTGELILNSVFEQSGTNYSATFRGVAVSLDNAIVVRYVIKCDDLTDVNLKVEIDGETYRITSDEFEPLNTTNQYEVQFRNLQAKQMREPIKATICRGDSVISKTATYSVESYAAAYIINSSVLGNLVKCMMYYGDSAAAYFSK